MRLIVYQQIARWAGWGGCVESELRGGGSGCCALLLDPGIRAAVRPADLSHEVRYSLTQSECRALVSALDMQSGRGEVRLAAPRIRRFRADHLMEFVHRLTVPVELAEEVAIDRIPVDVGRLAHQWPSGVMLPDEVFVEDR